MRQPLSEAACICVTYEAASDTLSHYLYIHPPLTASRRPLTPVTQFEPIVAFWRLPRASLPLIQSAMILLAAALQAASIKPLAQVNTTGGSHL